MKKFPDGKMETAFIAEFFVSQLRKSNRKIAHFGMAHKKLFWSAFFAQFVRLYI